MNTAYSIKYYKDIRGKSPFLEWLENLNDLRGRAKIKIYVDRLEKGNFGNSRSLGGGLHELKINFGPGYRVYYGLMEQHLILILCGGSKQSQSKDIEKARNYWMFIKEKIS